MHPPSPQASPARSAEEGAAITHWRCGRHRLDMARMHVMGVLNVTPDSFSDGGKFSGPEAAVAQAQRLIEEGAAILDIGGESTRPGAQAVPLEEQRRRVLPVLRALRDAPVPLSVDTSLPELMREALDLGASIVNDIRALQAPGAVDAVRGSDCGVVVMHMQGEPRSMQHAPQYADVVAEVRDWLAARREALVAAGVDAARIALDPGFGFGKAHAHNRRLLAGLAQVAALGQPLLVGLSRKSTLGDITGRAVDARLAASLGAALVAAERGARIVRAHDVAATRDALAVWSAIREEAS